ncbi:hypothetical protein RCL1_006634 [Eukaryota sp. TZLM3-RCL]
MTKPSRPAFVKRGTNPKNNDVRKSVLGRQLRNLNSGHKGAFIDKRIGAKIKDNPEEAAMMRFVKQKQFKAEKLARSIADTPIEDEEEENQILLTHGGKTINFEEMDGEFQDDEFDPDKDSDEEGFIGKGDTSARITSQLHFGGGEEGERTERKSSAEIYAEVIAKSKKARTERATLKHQNEQLMDNLDNQFDWLRDQLIDKGQSSSSDDDTESIGDFASLANQLEQESKARALEKSMTDEEKAKKLLLKLKRLEKERLEAEESDGHSSEDNVEVEENPFDHDDEEESEQEYDDESEQNEQENIEEESEEEEMESEVDDDVIKELSQSKMNVHESRKHQLSFASDGLPSTFPFIVPLPSSIDELISLLSPIEPRLHTAVFSRLFLCRHPSLGPEAKEESKRLLVLMFSYFDLLISKEDSLDLALNKFTSIVFVLEKLIYFFPKSVGLICTKRLGHVTKMIDKYRDSLSGPPSSTLLFLNFVLSLFPLDQASHPVVNSVCFVLSKLIVSLSLVVEGFVLNFDSKISTVNLKHLSQLISKCLFSLNLITLLSRGGIRFFPEPFFLADKLLLIVLKLLVHSNVKIDEISGEKLSFDVMNGNFDGNFSIFYHPMLEIIKKLFHRHLLDPSFSTLAAPFITTMQQFANISAEISEFSDYLQHMSEKAVELREPLRFQTLKPQPIREFKPLFSMEYDPERKGSLDVDRQRREKKRMDHLIKKEHRGAVRELRKDADFIAGEKRNLRRMEVKKVEESRKRIMSELEKEAAEYNSYDRQKEREKKQDKKRVRK